MALHLIEDHHVLPYVVIVTILYIIYHLTEAASAALPANLASLADGIHSIKIPFFVILGVLQAATFLAAQRIFRHSSPEAVRNATTRNDVLVNVIAEREKLLDLLGQEDRLDHKEGMTKIRVIFERMYGAGPQTERRMEEFLLSVGDLADSRTDKRIVEQEISELSPDLILTMSPWARYSAAFLLLLSFVFLIAHFAKLVAWLIKIAL